MGAAGGVGLETASMVVRQEAPSLTIVQGQLHGSAPPTPPGHYELCNDLWSFCGTLAGLVMRLHEQKEQQWSCWWATDLLRLSYSLLLMAVLEKLAHL